MIFNKSIKNKHLLFLLLSIVFLFSAIEVADDNKRRVIAVGGINVRKSPSMKGKKMGALPYGTIVTILNKKLETTKIGNKIGTWALIKSSKLQGWIFDAYTEKLSSPFIPYRWRIYKQRFARLSQSRNGKFGSKLEKKFKNKFSNYFNLCRHIEKQLLPRFKYRVKRKKGKLLLKLRTGRWHSLIDKNPKTNFVFTYYFRGTLLNNIYYVVIEGYYEGSSVLLINSRNGKHYKVDSLPAISPNKRYIAILSNEDPYTYNGLEIWKINQSQLKLIFKKKIQGAYLYNPVWVSHFAIRIINRDMLNNPKNYFMAIPIKGKWRLF